MVNAAMPALLLIPPLHLDAVNAVVVDPSEQVLELLTRRPTAVVSTIAAIVARHDVRTVAFLEPVAGLADGGYARQCVRLLETDLAARGVLFGRVAPEFSELAGARIEGGVIVVDRPEPLTVTFPDSGTALLIEPGRPQPAPVVVDPLISLTLHLHAPGPLDADGLLRLLLAHGRAVVDAHPFRFVLAQAVLSVDRPVRRLLHWPGVMEQALDDLRTATARLGLRLWWDEVVTVPAAEDPTELLDGVECRDPLVADLLGVSAR